MTIKRRYFNASTKDLKDAFPETQGFSSRNLKYMRKFAECWSDFGIV